MDIATFRADFPAFANVTNFPDAAVTFWLRWAGKLLNVCVWGEDLDLGTELFVAHNLVLERGAEKSAATGAVPGVSTGPVAAKGVDKVTVSYDTTAAMEADAGHWNLTIYGSRFARMMRMFGAGGIQL